MYPTPNPPLTAAPTSARQRRASASVWPAALTLFLLAPILGEIFSTSTPPTKIILDPISFPLAAALYGSGAILIREIVRRRQLPWFSLFLLGAAYGILEEALITNTWFNPQAGVGLLGVYGRAWGVNWLWAGELTIFHAVVSIAIPIVIVDTLFPRVASRPWLRTGGVLLFFLLLAAVSILGAISWGFHTKDKSYPHPPAIPYLGAALLMVALIILSHRLRLPAPRPALRAAPHLWQLRLIGFGATLAVFIIVWLLPVLIPLALIPIALLLALVIALTIRIRQWSTLAPWGAPQRLALASGVITYFMLLAPILFLRTSLIDAQLMLLLDLAMFVLLIRLTQRAEWDDPSAPLPVSVTVPLPPHAKSP
ncbi:MAG: hypothetical protein OJF49_001504 [Ktedonobacterales bacterium]|jgi:hypothetical protein|nr:MAG: hypothetical protein OJF49_001504 [Ktedonobacterales bacterium]